MVCFVNPPDVSQILLTFSVRLNCLLRLARCGWSTPALIWMLEAHSEAWAAITGKGCVQKGGFTVLCVHVRMKRGKKWGGRGGIWKLKWKIKIEKWKHVSGSVLLCCSCVPAWSGHSLVFRHHWVINIISRHGCDQSLWLEEPLDVYHTCLRPKQQAGSTVEHQSDAFLPPSLTLALSPPSLHPQVFFLFYFSFSSPASLDLPLSLTSTRVSRCGLDKKKRKKKKKRAWDVSQWKWFPYGVEIFAFKRSLQRGTSSEKMRWCNVFFWLAMLCIRRIKSKRGERMTASNSAP